MWLLAGPNGAGKTTTARELLTGIDEVLNPDEIALELSPKAPLAARLRAGREVIRRTRRLLESKSSFARETTLTGRAIFETVRQAKSAGYRVGLLYIGSEERRACGCSCTQTKIARRTLRSRARRQA
ncbi:MAG: AAA family ATPase [Candidatus Binataceae bacterium]